MDLQTHTVELRADSPDEELYSFLLSAFSVPELISFLVLGPEGDSVYAGIPVGATPTDVVTAGIQSLKRRRLLDEVFFLRLRGRFPRRIAEVERLASLFGYRIGRNAETSSFGHKTQIIIKLRGRLGAFDQDALTSIVADLARRCEGSEIVVEFILSGSVVIVVSLDTEQAINLAANYANRKFGRLGGFDVLDITTRKSHRAAAFFLPVRCDPVFFDESDDIVKAVMEQAIKVALASAGGMTEASLMLGLQPKALLKATRTYGISVPEWNADTFRHSPEFFLSEVGLFEHLSMPHLRLRAHTIHLGHLERELYRWSMELKRLERWTWIQLAQHMGVSQKVLRHRIERYRLDVADIGEGSGDMGFERLRIE
ncbi:hypothetical protein [Nannocystis bainbridge]|uniref:Uncharacterized protein n=1 Tax=Nannocystis bainbridge TaxID=2995303 RepID=A0ABT5EC43_9BACT|nr:hypothetical protein [Nannocystis bainbridge]MDC0723426.1 hypothetical protein [Nannocystis bainbridge]